MKSKPADIDDTSDVSSAAISAIIPLLRAYAIKRMRSGSNADDVVQDTVERAWRARRTFIPGADLEPWIFSILRNAITDRYRRDKFLVQDVDGVEAGRLVTEPDQFWRLRYAEVVKALTDLNGDQRRALLLVLLGVTNVEAAELMGCALGTFKGHVRLGRRKLRASGI